MPYPQRLLIRDFLRLGEEYRRAYYDLPERVGPPSWPKYFLFCHSIELILKAFLAASAAFTQRELKDKFGHDLKALMDEACVRGPVLCSTARANIEDLTDAHTEYWPRYPMEKANPVFIINRAQFEPDVTTLFVAVNKALYPSIRYEPYLPVAENESAQTKPPSLSQWDTSKLSIDRRAYLDDNLSFEQIASEVLKTATVVQAAIVHYREPRCDEAKGARQIIFRVQTSARACDLLYNAPDGMRGRYWQSPEHGSEATRHLIKELLPALTMFAETNPPDSICNAHQMSAADICTSLEAPSAKVWPRERDDQGDSLILEFQDLLVPRWQENEELTTDCMWRKLPTGRELEIKGALLGLDRTEYVPRDKRSRSCQIHHTGFT